MASRWLDPEPEQDLFEQTELGEAALQQVRADDCRESQPVRVDEHRPGTAEYL
jgi:hypothetical protein